VKADMIAGFGVIVQGAGMWVVVRAQHQRRADQTA
jgi:hypothetical protein